MVSEMAIKRLASNDVTMCNNTKNGLSGIVCLSPFLSLSLSDRSVWSSMVI